uniref:C2H2-type domain-containing protein n=1 Tax=Rhipicephalus microplus TaxID=6941 RepID=A0A6G5AHT2_RHIMP
MPSKSCRLSAVQVKCIPCNKSFTGPKSYAEHRESKQHQRRCGEIPSVASPPSRLPSAPDLSPSQNPNSKPYKCLTCNERFPGPESYEKHGDFSINGKGCLSGELSSPAIKNLIQCNACNTDISGVQNMKEHDKGKSTERLWSCFRALPLCALMFLQTNHVHHLSQCIKTCHHLH